eukprot:TRINITY_DN4125_c0_g1_i9.p1 TRINITY_DN4125_c0_g1~~TRINITY_DN4125_c0_g1_i9.p1  ORF type:complete len:256 (-),score=54.83 TRINITY_DN4125_c0_g1_i9:212-979(-)
MLQYAVGAGTFHSYSQTPYCALKPTQRSSSSSFYKTSTRNVPDAQGYFANYQRFGSVYNDKHNKAVKPSDYLEANIASNNLIGYDYAHEPRLLLATDKLRKHATEAVFTGRCFTKTATGLPKVTRPELYKTTAHWRSTYNHFNDTALKTSFSPNPRPEWSNQREAHTSKRGYYDTEHEGNFGQWGERPRDLLPSTATQLLRKTGGNYLGTTKVTYHIPGYTGFIPQSDASHEATEQAKGKRPKTTLFKANVAESL